ncbi:MAG: TetR/AcrR family transcriptional regulator [Rhodobacterales bacterium]|nr:TetR/AcrR family transcriptional regulator [Rhodobacterales bacterium]
MDNGTETKGWRGSADLWLDAAYQMLIESGVDQVKLGPLAERLGLSRTSFYGHFDSRESLLAELIHRWQARNTGNLIARTEAYAESISEALFNLFDCWLMPDLFDARLDFAVRNWALGDPTLRATLEQTDRDRIAAITAMFARFGFPAEEAQVRAYTVYYTQIGYISMMVRETVDLRIRRMPIYVRTFAGVEPKPAEIARFMSRHGFEAN